MKVSSLSLGALALLSLGLAVPNVIAQNQTRPAVALMPLNKVVRGEAMFLERIALPPGAMLHVSLVGRIAGAEYLPLATQITPARSGITPFQFQVPTVGLPAGPYRLQAWIIADNRAMFIGRDAKTEVNSLDKPLQIRLKMQSAPQNIDGIGDRPLPAAPQQITLRGEVFKLDRRGLNPDSRVEIQLRDVSLADAPSKLITGQVIQLEGAQLPVKFELQIDKSELSPRRRYALNARVLEANKFTYTTDTVYEVSAETAAKPLDLRVVPVGG